MEPYFDTLKTHISRHYKPCGVGVKLLTYLEDRFTATPKRLFQVCTKFLFRKVKKVKYHLFNFQLMLRTNQLAVNCEVVDGDYVLKEGDVIMHTIHKHEYAILDLEVEVVHDSEEMLVVSKPSSWPVYPVSNYRMNTLSYVLQKEMGYTDLRAMHRIDAATSGICMMAKGWRETKKCFLINFEKVGKQRLVSPPSSGPVQLARSILPSLTESFPRMKLFAGSLLIGTD